MYDAFFEYRFIYKLRNYSQHCGFPITNIEFDVKNNRQGNEFEVNTRLNAFFNRDELLKNYDGWNVKIKQDIKNQPENFRVMWVIGKYYQCIEEIYNEFEKIELLNIFNSFQYLKKVLKNYGELTKDIEPCIFYNFQYSKPNSMENLTFSILNLPIDLINEIDNKLTSTGT